MPNNLEVVWVKVRPQRLPRNVPVLFYAIIYLPSGSPIDLENELIEHLLEGFDSIRTNYPDAGITLFGDINHLDTRQLCSGNGLIQVVDKPTRGDAILDKIITKSLETRLICILLLASRDVHFEKKNDILLKWSIVKSTSEPKPQRKAYHLKDTSLLCDFEILFVLNLMICFYE